VKHCRIGDCCVDFARKQISTPDGNTLTLEPKVMDVLHILTLHQGEVITQQDIFSQVWGDTTYSPGTIQRAIALLRKAFGDDAKASQYIKTYPKRGYSLIAGVTTTDHPATEKTQRKGRPLNSVYTSFLILCLIVTAVYMLYPEAVKTEFSRLYPVTTNTDNEYDAQYDPGGQYLLFLRDLPQQNNTRATNQIWVRQLATSAEYRLTEDTGVTYAGITWSPNGQNIAYVQKGAEADHIGYLNFDPITATALANTLVASMEPRTVLGHRMQWSQDNHLYFIELPATDNSAIIQLDLLTGKKNSLIDVSGKDKIMNIALSPDDQTLAYVKSVKQNRYEIRLLHLQSNDDSLLTTLENSVLGISWHPEGQHILASNKTKLQLINRSGKVENIQFNNFNLIIDATYSPDGRQIVMQATEVDIDILYSEAPFEQHRKLVDSKTMDILPSFSPDESEVLFLSNRNGKQQLFITKIHGSSQLIFDNPDEHELFGFAWSPDAKQVVTASKDTLFFIDLNNGSVQSQHHGQSPFYIQKWYSHEPALLVSRFEQKHFIPAKYHYQTGEFDILDRHIAAKECLYMTLDEYDRLMITDGQQVVRLSPAEPPEVLWQSQQYHINGFALDNQKLVLIQSDHDNIDKFLISKARLDTGLEEPLYQYDANQFKVVSGNQDHSKLLFHSSARIVRSIVRLE
jgi:transcriptional activator of cad operon